MNKSAYADYETPNFICKASFFMTRAPRRLIFWVQTKMFNRQSDFTQHHNRINIDLGEK